MYPTKGFHQLDHFDPKAAADHFRELGYRVFSLPSGISDRGALIRAVKAAVPLDPPIQGDDSWDAFSDSLWGGLDSLETRGVALLWPGSAQLREKQPEDYAIAGEVFADICSTLVTAQATSALKQIVVLCG